MCSQPQLVKIDRSEWIVEYPEIIDEFSDLFFDALELGDADIKKSIKMIKKVIQNCGISHLDAILNLGLMYYKDKNPIEGNALICKAHYVAMQAIPKRFDPKKNKISWGYLENRPLLRTFQAMGAELIEERQYEQALEKFQFLINVNPNDNQGARYPIIECLFHLRKYQEFLEFEEKNQDYFSLEFCYGKVLALIKTNQIEKAKLQLDIAKKEFPKVFNQLTKKVHSLPEENQYSSFGVIRGSDQEAYLYYMRNLILWEDTEVKKFLSEFSNN